jgi:hypothetical protein
VQGGEPSVERLLAHKRRILAETTYCEPGSLPASLEDAYVELLAPSREPLHTHQGVYPLSLCRRAFDSFDTRTISRATRTHRRALQQP